MKKNVFDKNRRRYKITLILIFIAFILGALLGYITTRSSTSEIELELENLHLDLRSFNEYLIFAETFDINSCDDAFIEQLNNNIFESGVILDSMEQEGELDTPQYTILKQRHNINQVIFYSKLKQFKEKCDYEKDVILFFFDGEKPDEALKQGQELKLITDNQDVIVLPMDYGYTQHISYFYDYYAIDELPALIINYDTIIQGHSNKEQILNALN